MQPSQNLSLHSDYFICFLPKWHLFSSILLQTTVTAKYVYPSLLASGFLLNFAKKWGTKRLESGGGKDSTPSGSDASAVAPVAAGSCKSSGDQMAEHLFRQANALCTPALAGIALFGSSSSVCWKVYANGLCYKDGSGFLSLEWCLLFLLLSFIYFQFLITLFLLEIVRLFLCFPV